MNRALVSLLVGALVGSVTTDYVASSDFDETWTPEETVVTGDWPRTASSG